ncbi:MAG: hypothetical protein IJ060_03190 [Oscillospiraceae bacterium]|nr:hypothetical protein [Oscillospiraceae bacterium]
MNRKSVLIPACMLLMTACSGGAGGSSAPEVIPAPAGGFAGKWTLKEIDESTGYVFDGLLDQPDIPYSYVVQLELQEDGAAHFVYPMQGYDDTMYWSTFADAMRRNELDPEKPGSWGDALSAEETEKAKDYLSKNAVTVFRSETNWVFAGEVYYIPPDQPELLVSCDGTATVCYESAGEFPEVPAEIAELYQIMQNIQGVWGCQQDPALAMDIMGATVSIYRGSPDAEETLVLRRQPDNSFALTADGTDRGTLTSRGTALIRKDAAGTEQVFEMISDEEFDAILYGEDAADQE